MTKKMMTSEEQIHFMMKGGLYEAVDRFRRDLDRATPDILELARELQRLAFYDHDPHKAPQTPFDPAPLYLTQAMALYFSEERHDAFYKAWDKVLPS